MPEAVIADTVVRTVPMMADTVHLVAKYIPMSSHASVARMTLDVAAALLVTLCFIFANRRAL